MKHPKKIYAIDLSPREWLTCCQKCHQQKALPLLRLASASLNDGWKTDATRKARLFDGLPKLAGALVKKVVSLRLKSICTRPLCTALLVMLTWNHCKLKSVI